MNIIPINELCLKARRSAKDIAGIEEVVDYAVKYQQHYSLIDLHYLAECIEDIIRQNGKRDMRTFKIAMSLVDIRFIKP